MGSTWNRAAKVAESGSFEVKAGGATAAVEGLTFAVLCSQGAAGVSCEFLDVTDPITVTTDDGQTVQMNSATSVVVDPSGAPGPVQTLTYDQLAGNAFVAGNLLLDQQAGIGRGLVELGLPPASTTTTTTTTPPPSTTETTQPPATTTAAPPPAEDPRSPWAGTWRRSSTRPTARSWSTTRGAARERRGVPRRRVPAERATAGALRRPADRHHRLRRPGQLLRHVAHPARHAARDHLLTVRGTGCELNVVITVTGSLAFTGSSDRTSTFVLVGVAAIVVGLVLVVGARRRRSRGVPAPTLDGVTRSRRR